MAEKFSIYWYQKSDLVKNAFLFNCRDDDLQPRPGSRIEKGQIVAGAVGLVAAQEAVPGYAAKPASFQPNRQCDWQGLSLKCMAHPTLPAKPDDRTLRDFNYAVAELPNTDAIKLAANLGLPVLQDSQGRNLINVEISRFQRQGKANPHRAKLL